MDKFLEDIRVAENAWSVKTTRDYASLRKIAPSKPISVKIFKPSPVLKLAAVSFLAIPVIVILELVHQKTVTGDEIAAISGNREDYTFSGSLFFFQIRYLHPFFNSILKNHQDHSNA